MQTIFKMGILDVQPSQLFISEMKLKKVLEWLDYKNIAYYQPIPVKKLNGKIIFTDGHTRAFALFKMGIKDIRCTWDEDNLNWEAYQICVDWCMEDGISNISHLEQKVINKDSYEILWCDRCKKMHEKMEEKEVSKSDFIGEYDG
ncbi:MAG: hypothetical protein ACERKN_19470 [Velocimicrobium sp.]